MYLLFHNFHIPSYVRGEKKGGGVHIYIKINPESEYHNDMNLNSNNFHEN